VVVVLVVTSLVSGLFLFFSLVSSSLRRPGGVGPLPLRTLLLLLCLLMVVMMLVWHSELFTRRFLRAGGSSAVVVVSRCTSVVEVDAVRVKFGFDCVGM
jgi:lysophospholipid acyltransferase (LPLAT)-like uncharacterized protein